MKETRPSDSPHILGVNRREYNGDPSAGKNKVWLGSEVIEVPSFDNAEAFVGKLRKTDSMKNYKLAGSILEGKSMAASERSAQRHFMQTTGMTMKFIQQVQRAQSAADCRHRPRYPKALSTNCPYCAQNWQAGVADGRHQHGRYLPTATLV